MSLLLQKKRYNERGRETKEKICPPHGTGLLKRHSFVSFPREGTLPSKEPVRGAAAPLFVSFDEGFFKGCVPYRRFEKHRKGHSEDMSHTKTNSFKIFFVLLKDTTLKRKGAALLIKIEDKGHKKLRIPKKKEGCPHGSYPLCCPPFRFF